MFQRLSRTILKKTIARAGIAKQVEATYAITVAQRILQKHIANNQINNIKPVYVKNRVLALELSHPALGYFIQKKAEAIIFDINNALGRPEIIRLQFLLPHRGQDEYSTKDYSDK